MSSSAADGCPTRGGSSPRPGCSTGGGGRDAVRLRLGGLKRQAQRELAPLPRLRHGNDVPIVKAGQLASQVKAEPGAGDIPVLRQPAETNEEAAHVLGHTTIAHSEDPGR